MSKCLFQPGGGLSKSKLKAVTAKATDVLSGKVIVDKDGNPLTGTIESKDGQTITPTSAAQTVACNGRYMKGDIKVNGDSNLVAGNILSGKTIFGVAGNVRKFWQVAGTYTASGPYSFPKQDSGSRSFYGLGLSTSYPNVSSFYTHMQYNAAGKICGGKGTEWLYVYGYSSENYKSIVSGNTQYFPVAQSGNWDAKWTGFY